MSSGFNSGLGQLATACDSALQEHLQLIRDIVRAEYVKEEGLATADQPVIDIDVSFDGTWQKGGYTSHYGIGVAIDLLSGYVVDYEVLSKFCLACEIAPKEGTPELEQHCKSHEGLCAKTFIGSSPAMEAGAAVRIWQRSRNSGMRYVTMLSDGDSKAFNAVCEAKVYGDKEVKKEECVNHVAKRMGAV